MITNPFDGHDLRRPALDADRARRIATEIWHLDVAEVSLLASHQDANALITTIAGQRLVLKVANAVFGDAELAAQDEAADLIAERCPLVHVARSAVPATDGRIRRASIGDAAHLTRLVHWVDGLPFWDAGYLAPTILDELGRLAGRCTMALADWDHPAAHRILQWDCVRAGEVIDALIGSVGDHRHVLLAADVRRKAGEILGRLDGDLPRQVLHADLTDMNVLFRRRPDGRPGPAGVIDFGDLSHTWRVAELAVMAASFVGHAPRQPLQLVRRLAVAFAEQVAVTDAEIEALWPMILWRSAAGCVSGDHQLGVDGVNDYVAKTLDLEWEMLDRLAAIPFGLAEETIRHALRRPSRRPDRRSAPAPTAISHPRPDSGPSGASSTNPEFGRGAADADGDADADGPRWLTGALPEVLDRSATGSFAFGQWAEPSAAAVGIHPYGEGRVDRSVVNGPESATISLGIEFLVPPGLAVSSPVDGTTGAPSTPARIEITLDSGLTLRLYGIAPIERVETLEAADPWDVHGEITQAAGADLAGGIDLTDSTDRTGGTGGTGGADGADGADGAEGREQSVIRRGDPLGITTGAVFAQLVTDHGLEPPRHCLPSLAEGWMRLCPDPSRDLGLATVRRRIDPHLLLERRSAAVARNQELYYADPPQIELGWRHHLFDTDGRAYLDMVNNVAILGHSHQEVQAAVARQLRLLNTNSRFNYSGIVEFSERLIARVPDPLDTVFLVSTGSEANDLALRIAWAATGQRDVLAMRSAYHGWTMATDAISTSLLDNPAALTTRPEWVHLVEPPNTYRGRFTGPDAAALYAADVDRVLGELNAAGRAPAAFLAEALYGNAGGVPLPDGYLALAYAAVRAAGGICIADEVQVGYGRLGQWFWAFEQQGVVPDIVTIAKATGNGVPVAAVITTAALAEAFRSEGSFFASMGGSPMACAAGIAVLETIEQEGLQDNAEVVGGHLRVRLDALAARHRIIGAVHGYGLYLGVELVEDRVGKRPATAAAVAICERMAELGVIVQPTGDGNNVLKVKPPLCIDLASADFFVDSLDEVLTTGW